MLAWWLLCWLRAFAAASCAAAQRRTLNGVLGLAYGVQGVGYTPKHLNAVSPGLSETCLLMSHQVYLQATTTSRGPCSIRAPSPTISGSRAGPDPHTHSSYTQNLKPETLNPKPSSRSGFRNLGNSCYMAAVVSVLVHLKPFVADLEM